MIRNNPNQDTEGVSNADTASATLMQRLDRRREDGEDREDVIVRLLDETVEEVPIETVIDEIFDHYEHVAAIEVRHPVPDPNSLIDIVVHTSEVNELHEWGPLYESGRSHAVITTEDDERFVVPFQVLATSSGPETLGTTENTPVYVADSVVGAQPRAVDEGLDRLRWKLGTPTDEVRATLRAEREHEE